MVMGPMRCMADWVTVVWSGGWMVMRDHQLFSVFFSLLPLFRCQFTKPTWLVSWLRLKSLSKKEFVPLCLSRCSYSMVQVRLKRLVVSIHAVFTNRWTLPCVCWVVLSHRLIAVTSVSIQFNNKMIRCWGHISQIVTISTAKETSLLGSSSNWNWLVLDIAGSEFGGDNCCLNQPSQCHLVSKTVVEMGLQLNVQELSMCN